LLSALHKHDLEVYDNQKERKGVEWASFTTDSLLKEKFKVIALGKADTVLLIKNEEGSSVYGFNAPLYPMQFLISNRVDPEFTSKDSLYKL